MHPLVVSMRVSNLDRLIEGIAYGRVERVRLGEAVEKRDKLVIRVVHHGKTIADLRAVVVGVDGGYAKVVFARTHKSVEDLKRASKYYALAETKAGTSSYQSAASRGLNVPKRKRG